MAIARESNAAGAAAILDGGLLAPEELLNNPDIKGLFVYQDDPFHYLNGQVVKDAFSSKEFLLAADAMTTSIMDIALLTVPIGAFAEKTGTYVAQDGYVRTLGKAMETGPGGFEFLRALLEKLGGAVYADVQAVTNRIREQKALRVRGPGQGETGERRLSGQDSKATNSRRRPHRIARYKLILRDIFSNHHLLGKDVYSKGVGMVYSAPGYPVSEDKLYIAPEDAEKPWR